MIENMREIKKIGDMWKGDKYYENIIAKREHERVSVHWSQNVSPKTHLLKEEHKFWI